MMLEWVVLGGFVLLVYFNMQAERRIRQLEFEVVDLRGEIKSMRRAIDNMPASGKRIERPLLP